ncbi:uncharacterized protein BT62DRAFT_1076772 [Guyanagaster necrorhizus]|uniref:Uncharacterized protein n=1 Tax=Guyanagaster necrorhizus TaxID=856835 RepID=A0A9P7VQQ8_9AGAR|nr:uncharacterized protein BT62DRAFT_1076772 [Guyanagaster necrorhizus MCA 3950]KAG7445693.1 hypothetical protein BT62DRAFT_1076772 [Guyanagaster necrorhizus MCA 3950]
MPPHFSISALTSHSLLYTPPLTRSPSPNESLGSNHGDDKTSFSDSESVISQSGFNVKHDNRLKLYQPRPEEEAAEQPVLIERPTTPSRAQELAEQIVDSLRRKVRMISQNEIIEQEIMFRGSRIGTERPQSSMGVDEIIQSMMPNSQKQAYGQPPGRLFIANKEPWAVDSPPQGYAVSVPGQSPAIASPQPSRRRAKGKRKT